MPHLPDHCHISFAITANFVNRDSLEASAELILTEYNRLFWNIKSKDRLKDSLKSRTVQSRLETAVKHDNINTAAELLSETLVEACKEAGLKVRNTKFKCKSQNKWFDEECETEKENLKSLGEKISHNTNNSEMRQLLRDKKKRFKQTCRRKKQEYISKGMSKIDMRNSRETWRQIGKIFKLGKRKTHVAETVSTEQFYKYFKQQNATPLNNTLNPENNTKTHSNESVEGPLDYPISDEEFNVAINKLKANKSPGIDKILNEVLKIGKDAIKGHLINLFNRILNMGKYPALWSFGLIVPVHKKDDRSKVENYRGITLLSALGKLFTSILNNRLYDYMVQNGILKAEQGGFRKMHGTVDSIFTLKMLIDKYVKSKPQKHRNLLFSCFVDFRKAFDCVPRQKLFDKLRKEGVHGRFLDVLISMYSNDKSAVKINNKLTQSFTCYAGVKQGCMLSPTLFNLYLSDLPKSLNTTSSTDIMLGDKSINCLLYADDLVIFSRSAKSLQIILNKLESFCKNADLSVNLDKTKIMVFNNCGKSLNNYSFRYGADELENVKSYRYLGLIMSPYGNFNLARQELKKVALKALYKLRKEMGNHFTENIKLTMKLFDALISPILFYASEVWGIDCNGQLEKDPAELVQNKFLKWLLGVNKYCNNNACRAETGRFPMRVEAQCRNFKFWLTLTKNENKLSQIAYNDIKWNENKACWSKKIKSLLDQIGFGEFWMKAHYADIGIMNMIRQRLKDIELQRWHSEINNDIRKDANQSNKMRTYRKFKTIDNYKCEDYLHQVTNTQHRIALTKLRLSNHKLAIETGRHSRPFKKPEERICPICKIEMEDEYHFLNICPAYQEKRDSLLDYLEKEYRIRTSRMSPIKIFMFLINPPSRNAKIQKLIAKHVFECFEKRKEKDSKKDIP